MTAAPDELARLDALARNRIMHTLREPEFDDLVRVAARITDSPMAMLSFVDCDRLLLKAVHGLSYDELPRERSFCDAAIRHSHTFSVYDAAADARFAEYVLVSSAARVRSYAGVPLHEKGCALGTLAVLDTKPRLLSREQLELLESLARHVLRLLELRRLRDTRLLKTEALLASATRISGIGCWQWNLASGEITWSDELYGMLGLPKTMAASLDALNSRVHPDDRPLVAARTALALEGGLTEFPAFRIERPNGELRVLQATAELERDASGRPTLLTGALLDVTEQRRAEEARKQLAMQVMRTQKLESLGVVSAGVAHDFNNLLVGILGNAELASADSSLSPSTRELMGRVIEASIKAAGLTRQLLAYTGRGHLNMVELDLSSQTLSSLEVLRSSLPRSIVLSSTLARELPALEADAEQLQQVIMNLTVNAAESYGGAAGEVHLRTYLTNIESEPERTHDLITPSDLVPGRYVVLEVTDQGSGMDRNTLERMFEPFFSTKFTGRGLGLAAVLGIARRHRAVLTVDSRLAEGSCFRVHFPALAESARAVAPRKAPPSKVHALAGTTVLVIDDEPRVRLLERHVLEGQGVQVLEAESGDAAIELLSAYRGPLDVVLLDLAMPGLDSASTLSALRALRPDVPVVIQSGFSEEEVSLRLRAIDEELAFLAKPFSPKTLVAQVSQMLQKKALKTDSSRP
ncbi:MAG: sensory box histidine kinase/response regulator [Myxococcaceae bacterium]|nr:sensory box histidine kinase/response regulator [Myxococcaceae bacterium]